MGFLASCVTGEDTSADVEAVEPFKIYNADESGLCWMSLPKNTQLKVKASPQDIKQVKCTCWYSSVVLLKEPIR